METDNGKFSIPGALTLLLLSAISFAADLVEIGRLSLGLRRSGSQQAGCGVLKAAPMDSALSAAAPEHPIIECCCPSDLTRQSKMGVQL